MSSIAVKYRPQEFEDVCGQSSVITILKRQLEIGDIKNCYLFCGPSGTGKTTLARIFANKINNNQDTYIEMDAASNNGVENVRNIIKDANERSLDSEYKIFIIDEAHMITTAAWNAFLKTIEEPPKYTIFLFCTTDPNKIPNTILNRVMRFNLTRVPVEQIKNRLMYVCQQENFTNYEETCDYISKISFGGMRDSLALLEKASSYSNDLNINNVLQSLGNFSYDVQFDLTDAMTHRDEESIIRIVNYCFNNGNDLKLFVTQFLDFNLDLLKFTIFNSLDLTKFPSSYLNDVIGVTSFDGAKDYFRTITNKLLDLSINIKQDANPLTTVTISLISMSRGE